MHETADDLARLQTLLDKSFTAAGPHLLSIIRPERRLTAAELAERLQGMTLLVVATVTADGRPLAGPVDGLFYRGAFHFGSSPDSVRARHLAQRPQVTATHLPSEQLAVTVHGTAARVDTSHGGLRDTLLETYVPRYGEDWSDFLDSGPVYWRIDADRMFSFQMDEE